MAFHEYPGRSVAKTITFRILIILTDAIIIFVITGHLAITLGVILFSNLSSTIIYFFHERAWNKVHWGKVKRRRKRRS